jgi:aerobic C4-dicarboxylate transport protein
MEIVQKKAFYQGLTFQVFFAMGLGIVVGLLFPDFAKDLKLLGDIFLRLIKTAVAPLVFLTVVQGIAAAGDIKSVGKIGFKSLIYFEIVSTIALILGLLAANLAHIGAGLNMHQLPHVAGAALPKATEPFSFKQFMLDIFPDNFIGAFAGGHLLQVLVIAIIFGFAILALEPKTRSVVEEGIDKVAQCLFKFIDLIMKFAPIGAFGALAFAVGSNGTDVLIALINLVGLFYLVLLVFVLGLSWSLVPPHLRVLCHGSYASCMNMAVASRVWD